jgi:hypothetical protein
MNRATSQNIRTRREAEENLLKTINSIAEQIVKEGISREDVRNNLLDAFSAKPTRKPPWLLPLLEAIVTLIEIVIIIVGGGEGDDEGDDEGDE